MKTTKASQALKTNQDIVRQRVQHATDALAQEGVVGGPKDKKLSVRLESTLLDAARRQSGIREDSALVAAGLALLARHNSFGTFLASLRGQLSDDFEIGL
jgi:hypothetical protein